MTTRSTLTLRGARNQCPGCGEHFNSNHAFDMHRTGMHGYPIARRCMTPDEMIAKGMVKKADGFWVSSLRETKEDEE
jgi:hypothetical protein